MRVCTNSLVLARRSELDQWHLTKGWRKREETHGEELLLGDETSLCYVEGFGNCDCVDDTVIK